MFNGYLIVTWQNNSTRDRPTLETLSRKSQIQATLGEEVKELTKNNTRTHTQKPGEPEGVSPCALQSPGSRRPGPRGEGTFFCFLKVCFGLLTVVIILILAIVIVSVCMVLFSVL